MSDNEVTIVDQPSQPPQPPRQAPPTPTTPLRPKRKTRALSVGDEEDDDDEPAPPKKSLTKRPAKKKALAPPAERRATVFLEEPPAAARPATPAPTRESPFGRPPAASAASSVDPDGASVTPPGAGSGPVRPEPVRTVTRPAPAASGIQEPASSQPMTVADASASPSQAEVEALRMEVSVLRGLIDRMRGPASVQSTTILEGNEANDALAALEPLQADPFQLLPLRTSPNAKGEMPPVSVCHLAASMFPPGKKSSSEYHPNPVHSLFAHRLMKDLGYPPFEGKYSSPTAFLDLPCVKFKASIALAVAIYSGRIGARGATIAMFMEANDYDVLLRGSSNANFHINFNGDLDPSPDVSSYDDILSGLNGLGYVANDLWYEHGRKLISRLRAFVMKTKASDVSGTPERIQLCYQFVNKFLGRAAASLQNESDQWWALYCEELKAIDVANPEWSMAVLNSMTMTIRREAALLSSRRAEPSREYSRDRGAPHDNVKRPSRMPPHIKALIPSNSLQQEPCLRHLAGCCPGGPKECTSTKLLHKWPSALPPQLIEWARANIKAKGPADHGSHA